MDGDEPSDSPPERERPERDEQPDHKEREQWTSRTERALKLALETQQSVNQALSLQSRRMDDLAKLHESHTRQWEETLEQTRELMKAAREAQASADQARSELVSVTAALVKISQVQQQMLNALADEQ